MKFLLFLLPALLAAAPPVTAQSLLLSVRETLNGSPQANPLSSREGLAAALFDDGFIVFDLPGGAPPEPDGILKIAVAAGADYVLELIVDFSGSGAGAPRVTAHAEYALRKAAGGLVVLRGTLDGTNRDRESTVDWPALGREMGGVVADKVRQRLTVPAPK